MVYMRLKTLLLLVSSDPSCKYYSKAKIWKSCTQEQFETIHYSGATTSVTIRNILRDLQVMFDIPQQPQTCQLYIRREKAYVLFENEVHKKRIIFPLKHFRQRENMDGKIKPLKACRSRSIHKLFQKHYHWIKIKLT